MGFFVWKANFPWDNSWPKPKLPPEELLEQLRRDRPKIAAELPELVERGHRLEEAAAENSLTGHLRRAIHRCGQPLQKIAAETGLDVFVLCDFLEGTRTLRSDVLDRLAQAVGASIHLEPTKPPLPDNLTKDTHHPS